MNSDRPLLDPSPRPDPASDLPALRGTRAESDRSAAFSSSQKEKEISDEDARVVHINNPSTTNETLEFSGNSIKTTKYSLLTFLPRNLFEQFHRIAYIYFLIIAILNQLPQLAVFGRGASILPLAFVLLVTAVMDAYEDRRRHRSYRIENNRTVLVLDANGNGEAIIINATFQPKRWKEIRVGEVLKVLANETLPCDMVLLATSDPSGVAYIQTINLDGDSNLKTRYAKQETMMNAFAAPFSGLILCERPNWNIYGFHANMEIDGRKVSFGPSNIILRGCELKNTAWAVGAVAYAGREAKVMLNSSGAPSKRSRLETHMNRETLLLSGLLIASCSVVTVLGGIWLGRHEDDLDYSPFFRNSNFVGDDNNYN